jgi:hypothetical protein
MESPDEGLSIRSFDLEQMLICSVVYIVHTGIYPMRLLYSDFPESRKGIVDAIGTTHFRLQVSGMLLNRYVAVHNFIGIRAGSRA